VDRTNGTLNRTVKNSAYFLRDYFSNSVTPFSLPKVSVDGSNPGTVTGSNKNNSASLQQNIAISVLLLSSVLLF
jgi:hypothetical protein